MSRYLSLLLFIGLVYWSCEENSKSVDGTDDEEQILIQKSAKRGLAFDLKNNDDFESIKEGWPPKVGLGKNVCHFTWLNMSGVTIIEMITLKTRKNSL